MSETNRPIHEVRVGGTITASIWRNEVDQGEHKFVSFNTTLNKRYYDKSEDAWKDSSSFFEDDLPKAALALNLAYEWIMLQSKSAAA